MRLYYSMRSGDMTEQEAREKWCPFVRLGSVQDTNHAEGYCWNNRGEDTHESDCIASDCMAWRSNLPTYVANEQGSADRRDAKPGGYCGLAGPA